MTMILNAEPIEILELQALDSIGNLKILPFSFWTGFSYNQIKLFMLKHGLYFIPTIEIIQVLIPIVQNSKSIEIGCGNGAIGRALNIPITDSKLQEQPEISKMYIAMGQPPIKYPSDVIKLDAKQAIEKYKPEVVIGSFITHKYNGIDGNEFGVDENYILKNVYKYVMIGNLDTHKTKPILKQPHYAIYLPQLITRSYNQSQNRIFIWTKK